jgi:CIC family chloride channel protein
VPESPWTSLRRIRRLFGGEAVFVIAIAAVLGLLTGFGALGFRTLVDETTRLAFGSISVLERAAELPWYVRLVLPAAGLLAIWPLCRWLAPEARGHGVPEVIDAVLHDGRIRPRVVAVKSVASAVTIGTGGSVGREGPIVQIGSAIGSSLSQLLGLDRHRTRVLVACGAAAGIAATFNAPVAGVAFAIEIVLGTAGIQTFTPIIVSTVLATTISRQFLEMGPAFAVPAYELHSPWELTTYAALGLLAGVVAVVFTRVLYGTEDLADRLPLPGWLVALGGGLVVGGIAVFRPEIYGLGYETIENALRGELALQLLLLLVVVKMIATSVTLAAGGSGGIFAPSLFLGAALGGVFGMVAADAAPWDSASAGAYALVGMGAVVAAATHAPLTAIIIIFELTADYAIMLPLMLACIISSIVAVTIHRESIYTFKLARRGTDAKSLSEAARVLTTPVQELVRAGVSTFRPDTPLKQVLDRVLGHDEFHHYVVDDAGQLLGVITLDEVKRVVREDIDQGLAVAYDIMDQVKPVTTEDTLDTCLTRFALQDVHELPVVDASGRLAGTLKRKDVISLYNRDVLHMKDLGLKFVSHTQEGERHDYVELPPTHSVDAVEVPEALLGWSLAELDFRRKHDLNVVEIRRRYAGRTERVAPDPHAPLQDGSILIVVGPEASIDWLKNGTLHEATG